ncbi:hypothetical protein HMPREF3039_03285 [Akkermansia sp. KLE1798]|nr:hypothetical protein HMPREF3039_03285 [Akkermansia sp. KLE1798]
MWHASRFFLAENEGNSLWLGARIVLKTGDTSERYGIGLLGGCSGEKGRMAFNGRIWPVCHFNRI